MLENTQKYFEAKKAGGYVDSFAVAVFFNGKRETIMSSDVNEDTFFDIASMGKVIVTSTLILQAVSKNLINLSDTLDMYFKNVPEEKRKITIEQMLTHTSGIIRISIPDRIADSGKDAVIEHILGAELKFAPGSDFAYSCNAYILLGYILENVYKKSLDVLYEENLVKPLGLTRSKFNISLDEENAAVCYRWKYPGKLRVDDENVYSLGGIAGNGASFSSLRDMSVFMDALLEKNEKLYNNDLFDIAEKDYTSHYSVGRGLGYQYVDERYNQTGKLFTNGSFGHCGHTGASFFIDRKKKLYVIVLSNATRCLNRKNNFCGYNYGTIMKMREEIHNCIAQDIFGL